MKLVKLFCLFVAIALVGLPAAAQVPTGTLSGHVTDTSAALPGVTVSVTSPALQGTRIAVTSENGDYIFAFLPPGDYTVRFELQGFQTLETTIKLSAAQTSKLNAEMPQSQVTEEITVTGSYETISTSAQAASTMTQELLNKLPVGQTFYAYAALAAGTASTGPSGNLTISGAQSWENLFMVNGVSIQDNIRNTPTNLFIEDAIQEATTQTAAISAEYGRFAGGVVNMLTKSGGNELHGSLRVNLDASNWSEKAPLQTGTLSDTLNKTYMATLGGWFWKDKLWYFLGYRDRSTENSTQTYVTNIPYTLPIEETRTEGKLTFSLTPNHRVIGSYIKNDQTQGNNSFGYPMDYASLYDRELPTDLVSGNYTGVLSDNFFVEAQYSRKTFSFVGSGSKYTDLIKGTLLIDLSRGNSYRYWSPTFCGVCDPEKRDNKEYILKGSYFLSTPTLGTHDIVVGYGAFDDQRFSNNHQSGSDFRIRGSSVIIRGGVIFPQWLNSNTVIRWTPIFAGSKGTNFWTKSVFLNDKWRLSNNWSFNLGLRYDKNDGKDSDGKLVAKDSAVSPRLAVTFDPMADGEWLINASYGRYVMAIANGIADGTAVGGQPGTIDFLYKGPEINKDPTAATLVDSATALQILFDWFNSVGGTDMTVNPYLDAADIPGATALIKDSLNSTSADEWTIGATKRFGNRGLVRLDYVNRSFHDFYALKRDMTTGTVTTPNGTFDKGYYINDDSALERKYYGVQMQFSFRPTDALGIGGNYTFSNASGNIEGENTVSGPVSSGIFTYPEYFRRSWAYPKGDLAIDQKHKARLWAVWDIFNTKHNSLSVSLLQSYLSGQPYSAVGSISLLGPASVKYVANPGYKTPPTYTDYFFSKRGAFHTDDEMRTDISANYGFKLTAFGANLEIFVEPRIINVFNAQALTAPNTSVYTSRNGGKGLVPFDPFNSKPVQCTQIDRSVAGGKCTSTGANWMKATTFGNAINYQNYQTPRTFTLSVGVRF
ncbi:MAG: TonB-dependent receptor [Acidobacteriota bacterium]